MKHWTARQWAAAAMATAALAATGCASSGRVDTLAATIEQAANEARTTSSMANRVATDDVAAVAAALEQATRAEAQVKEQLAAADNSVGANISTTSAALAELTAVEGNLKGWNDDTTRLTQEVIAGAVATSSRGQSMSTQFTSFGGEISARVEALGKRSSENSLRLERFSSDLTMSRGDIERRLQDQTDDVRQRHKSTEDNFQLMRVEQSNDVRDMKAAMDAIGREVRTVFELQFGQFRANSQTHLTAIEGLKGHVEAATKLSDTMN